MNGTMSNREHPAKKYEGEGEPAGGREKEGLRPMAVLGRVLEVHPHRSGDRLANEE